MTTLNLDTIVDVVVSVSPASAPRATFNQMLVVGSATVISVEDRLAQYTSTADMLADGFVITDAEYVAALKYFGQTPAPNILWVGRRDEVSSPPESVLEAIQACRAANAEWYICNSPDAIAADHLEIAAWAQTATPSTVYAYNTADSNVLTSDPTPHDVCTSLKDLSYSRTIGQYSTTANAVAGIMGVACGLNTGLANSAYTLFGKSVVGVTTESLTYNQKEIIEAKNCNCYLSYANYYNVFENGVMANGYFFDQVVNRDMLVNDIQLSCMDLIYQNPKIPQTEAGMGMIYNALVLACNSAVTRGHLGPGNYTGIPFLKLYTGDYMPNGYIIQSLPLSEQSSADRALRKATPFYITIKEAGAVHSITLQVVVNV